MKGARVTVDESSERVITMQIKNKLHVREYQTEDKDELKNIAKSRFDEDVIGMMDQPNTTFARTALYEGEIVGTVFAWKSAFHSNCLYARIFVTPSFEAMDIEKSLLHTLIKHTQKQHNPLPLQTSIWATSVGLKDLFEKSGFEELRRTYMPVLQVGEAVIPPLTLDSNIQTVEKVAQDEKLTNKLVELVQRNYMKTHMDNPVSEYIGQDVWKELVFAEDLLEKVSFVYVEEGEIVAYSFLHTSDEKDTFELGWCGATGDKDQGIIQKLVQHQILYTKERGISKLLGEFDTTDEAALSVLGAFPFEPCPTWLTYALEW